MIRVHRPAAAAMLIPITVASALMVGATPASAADGEIESPRDGQVVNARGPVAITAKTDWYQVSMSLYVEGPGVPRQKIGSGGADQTISGSFDPGNAPNGPVTLTLFGEITNKTYKTSTFVLSRPPEAPSGVEARLENSSSALVTWAKGAEPDLQSYEVSSVRAGRSGTVAVDTACSGSTCRATLAVPGKAAGEQLDVAVRAVRSDGRGGTIESPRSSAPPVAVPAVTPSPVASRKQDLSSPSTHTGKSRAGTSLPSPVPKLPATTSDNKLKLPDASEKGPEIAPVETGDPGPAAQSSFSPSGGLGYGVYIAIGVVLLLLGVCLGSWMRRREGRGGVGGSGPVLIGASGGAPAGPDAVAGRVSQRGATSGGKGSASSVVRRPSVILAARKPRDTPSDQEATEEQEAITGLEGPEADRPEAEPDRPEAEPDRPGSEADGSGPEADGPGPEAAAKPQGPLADDPLWERPRQPDHDYWVEDEKESASHPWGEDEESASRRASITDRGRS
ncbi:hypothetical protein [Microbispora sp. NPDC049125]|uniref:hypothetical protein n=1 Tax=Microbispora sp. NPDC049125 TaxID=3154929 RepID=UPI003465EFE6